MKKISFFLVLIAFCACQDKPELAKLVQDMVVQTNYDTTATFQNFATFTMPMDTIGLISNTTDASAIVSDYSRSITSLVRTQLEQEGYVYSDLTQAPDLGVNIYVVNDRSVYQSVSPGLGYGSPYGYGYPYGGGYGYGGYYGGYGGYYNYPYVSTYVSNQAILVIELADLKNSQTNNLKIVWTANIGDLISTVDQNAKVLEGVSQAFQQSPYLKK
jgi:hypothetical protein